MSTIENEVARHYTRGSLEHSILAGVAAAGAASAAGLVDVLAAVDEFHIGGREATSEMTSQLQLQPGSRVLDVGCGIGGTARFLASRYRCEVVGIDLTPEFVEVGSALNRRVGLADLIQLREGSALQLPFDEARFDRATVFHVGMNIADKPRLCREIARVLAPGGMLGLYDVMRTGDAPLAYPVPWAPTAATSFVETPAAYRSALEGAGFAITAERSRRDFALAFFRGMKARAAAGGPPPLGLHLLMGDEAAAKIANMIDNLERGGIAPVEMVARRL